MKSAEDIKGVKTKMFSLNESVKPTPKYQKQRLPLQRAVQLLKRHRDITFKDYSEEDKKVKPISCIITTLATHAYNGEDNIMDALINIINKMENFIETRLDENTGQYIKWIPNPVKTSENFADRWALPNSKREKFFKEWIEKLKLDFGIFNSPFNRISLSESLKNHLEMLLLLKLFQTSVTT